MKCTGDQRELVSRKICVEQPSLLQEELYNANGSSNCAIQKRVVIWGTPKLNTLSEIKWFSASQSM